MAFDVQDFKDLLQFLREHPEQRLELLRLILTDELLRLPQVIRELAEALRQREGDIAVLVEVQRRTEQHVATLAEAQRRTEERVADLGEAIAILTEAQRRTEERVARLEEIVTSLAEAQRRTEEEVAHLREAVTALTEAQRRTEERVARLEEIVASLAEAQRRTEAQVAALAEAQRRTEEQVAALAEAQRRTEAQISQLNEGHTRLDTLVADLKGRMMELTYRNKAPAFFGPVLRRPRVVELSSLMERLESHLSPEEFRDVLLLDLLVEGQIRDPADVGEVCLAIEISAVVDENDVERAQRRADLLHRAGVRAIPVVAGERITLGAEDRARAHSVVVLQDGRILLWSEAVRAWMTR